MVLRKEIEKLINVYKDDSENLAVEICKFLDEEISLSGNGWFDNDPVMIEKLQLEE